MYTGLFSQYYTQTLFHGLTFSYTIEFATIFHNKVCKQDKQDDKV